MELSEKAKEVRREYYRNYVEKNREKVKEQRKIWNKTYWEKQVKKRELEKQMKGDK